MTTLEFKYGFPLFSNPVTTKFLSSHDKIRISDIWAFWDYIIKGYGNRNLKKKYDFVFSLLEQAKYFYMAAESAPLKSKSLLYYYSFLNLAKIVINFKEYRGTDVLYNHGIETDVTTTTTIKDAEVQIKQLGSKKKGTELITLSVAKEFFSCLDDHIAYIPGKTYPIKILDCFKSCIGIHRTFCETYKEKETFYRLKNTSNSNPNCLFKEGHNVAFQAFVNKCDQNIMNELITAGYDIEHLGKEYIYKSTINLGARYTMNLSDWQILSQQLTEKGIWSYTDGEGSRLYIAADKLRISPASIIYCIMFFFGSITRYHPYLFESILSDKELWLVSEFLNTQPKQFLYYITSKVIGDNIYKSKFVNL